MSGHAEYAPTFTKSLNFIIMNVRKLPINKFDV